MYVIVVSCLLLAPSRCAVLWSVFWYVCLFVCMSAHVLKTTRLNFTKCSVHATYGHGSVLVCQRCSKLCTGTPVLWMTSCFHIMEQMDQNLKVCSSSPGGGTGGEVCHLWLHLVMHVTQWKLCVHIINHFDLSLNKDTTSHLSTSLSTLVECKATGMRQFSPLEFRYFTISHPHTTSCLLPYHY